MRPGTAAGERLGELHWIGAQDSWTVCFEPPNVSVVCARPTCVDLDAHISNTDAVCAWRSHTCGGYTYLTPNMANSLHGAAVSSSSVTLDIAGFWLHPGAIRCRQTLGSTDAHVRTFDWDSIDTLPFLDSPSLPASAQTHQTALDVGPCQHRGSRHTSRTPSQELSCHRVPDAT